MEALLKSLSLPLVDEAKALDSLKLWRKEGKVIILASDFTVRCVANNLFKQYTTLSMGIYRRDNPLGMLGEHSKRL